jgi:hypothetical protein
VSASAPARASATISQISGTAMASAYPVADPISG